MDMPVSPLKQEGRVGSRAIFIIWPKVMCTSLDSAGNMVGSKKNVVPNFMFVTMGGGAGWSWLEFQAWKEHVFACKRLTGLPKPAPSYFPGGTLLVRERI